MQTCPQQVLVHNVHGVEDGGIAGLDDVVLALLPDETPIRRRRRRPLLLSLSQVLENYRRRRRLRESLDRYHEDQRARHLGIWNQSQVMLLQRGR